jgi:hypothetical protein
MMEAGVLIDSSMVPIYWHQPAGRNMVALPDSRELWEVIWEHRKNLAGFAHTHPGKGVPGPSVQDITTFSAVELALGKRLDWWIFSEDEGVLVRWMGPESYRYLRYRMQYDFPWTAELRRLSFPIEEWRTR